MVVHVLYKFARYIRSCPLFSQLRWCQTETRRCTRIVTTLLFALVNLDGRVNLSYEPPGGEVADGAWFRS